MPIIVRFTTSAPLLYRAQMAVLRNVKWMRWSGIFVVFIFPLVMLGSQLALGETLQAALMSNLAWIVGFPVFWLLGIPLAQRWGASRTFRSTPAAQGEQVYTFDRDRITVAGGLSSGVLDWKAIIRSVETRDFFLLFLSGQMAHFLPKSAFDSDADVKAFRALVAENVHARSGPALQHPEAAT
jgi:hypothetical protein